MKTLLALILFLISCGATTAQTNAPPVDHVTQVLNRIETWASGVLALVTVILAWWGANRAKVASVVPTLVKAIETHGSDALRAEIKDAAGTAGVEPVLNKLVKDLTPTKTPAETVTIAAFQNAVTGNKPSPKEYLMPENTHGIPPNQP